MSKFPVVDEALKEGKIWVENGEYVGRASDGVIVNLGAVGCEANLTLYLIIRPDPKDW